MVRWLTSHLQQPGFNSWLWPLSPASCQCWEAASDGSRNWDPTTHVRPGLGFWQFAPAPASSNHCGYLESEPADGSPVSQIHFFLMKKKQNKTIYQKTRDTLRCVSMGVSYLSLWPWSAALCQTHGRQQEHPLRVVSEFFGVHGWIKNREVSKARL